MPCSSSRRTSASSGPSRRSSWRWARYRARRSEGRPAFILTNPVGRGAFLGAKLLSLGFVLALATLVAVVVGWIYTTILFEPEPIGGWASLVLLLWLGLASWAAITFLASTVFDSAAAAAVIGVTALIGLSVISAIPVVGRFLPPGLDGPALALATGRIEGLASGELATAIAGSIGLIVLAGLGSWLSFRHQEL